MTIKQKLKDLHTLGVFSKEEYNYLKLLIDIDMAKDKLNKLTKDKEENNVSR